VIKQDFQHPFRNVHHLRLSGTNFVLIGGECGACHLNAFMNLLGYAKNRPELTISVHLPADAIYVTHRNSGRGLGTAFQHVTLMDLESEKMAGYSRLMQHMGLSYELLTWRQDAWK